MRCTGICEPPPGFTLKVSLPPRWVERTEEGRGLPKPPVEPSAKVCRINKQALTPRAYLPLRKSPGPAETQHSATVRFMHEADLGLTMESGSFPTSF